MGRTDGNPGFGVCLRTEKLDRVLLDLWCRLPIDGVKDEPGTEGWMAGNSQIPYSIVKNTNHNYYRLRYVQYSTVFLWLVDWMAW